MPEFKYGRPIRDLSHDDEHQTTNSINSDTHDMFPKPGPVSDVLDTVGFIRLAIKASVFATVNCAAALLGTYLVFSVDPLWWGAALLLLVVLAGLVIGYGLQWSVNRWIHRGSQD